MVSNIHLFNFLGSERKQGHQEIMANVVSSYGIIIVGHFCKKVTFYVSFLEQYIGEEPRAPKKYLMIYPVRNSAPLPCSGDEDYSF